MSIAETSAKTAVDELKIALDNRAFEIQLFWQRSNYFLVLMTALGVGTFSVKDVFLTPLIASFAAGASWLWFRTNLGSKFWQESWEVEVNILASESKLRSFERTTAEAIEQVRASFESSKFRSPLRRWVDGQILKKPSVTYHMIVLSLISFCVWSVVAVYFAARLAERLNLYLFSCVLAA